MTKTTTTIGENTNKGGWVGAENRVENGLKVIGTGYEGTFDEGEVIKIEIANGNVEKKRR
jgi:hypothetical protein